MAFFACRVLRPGGCVAPGSEPASDLACHYQALDAAFPPRGNHPVQAGQRSANDPVEQGGFPMAAAPMIVDEWFSGMVQRAPS
jgi:hypothetical protein